MSDEQLEKAARKYCVLMDINPDSIVQSTDAYAFGFDNGLIPFWKLQSLRIKKEWATQQALLEILNTYTDKEELILSTIKCVADDVSPHKEYENTYSDGWLDACNTVYDEVFAILRKAQEK